MEPHSHNGAYHKFFLQIRLFSLTLSPIVLQKQTSKTMGDFSYLHITGVNNLPGYHATAAFTTKSSEVFKEAEEISPRHVSDKVSYMPWGADNELHTTADPKIERKIPALIADFCTYYAPHANHSVIYYYDTTALGSNYAVNDQDFHWVIVHEFERHGWSVQDVYLGNPMRQDEKYLLINQGFAGKQRLIPYFNRQMLCK